MSDLPIFGGWERTNGKFVFLDSAASAPRNGTQADGLCAQREFFPLLLRSGQRSKNSAGRTNWKVCVPRLTGRRKEKAMKKAQLRSTSNGTKPNLIR